MAALLIYYVRNGAGQGYLAGALPEVAAVAGQLKRAARGFAAKDIFGDKKHAVELGGHGHVGEFSRVVDNGGVHDGVREAEELVIEVLGRGLLVEGVLVRRGLILAGRVGKGILKRGRKVVKVIGWRKGQRGKRAGVSVWEAVDELVFDGKRMTTASRRQRDRAAKLVATDKAAAETWTYMRASSKPPRSWSKASMVMAWPAAWFMAIESF